MCHRGNCRSPKQRASVGATTIRNRILDHHAGRDESDETLGVCTEGFLTYSVISVKTVVGNDSEVLKMRMRWWLDSLKPRLTTCLLWTMNLPIFGTRPQDPVSKDFLLALSPAENDGNICWPVWMISACPHSSDPFCNTKV